MTGRGQFWAVSRDFLISHDLGADFAPEPLILRKRFEKGFKMWMSVSLLATITVLTLLGDYCIKLATNKETGLYSSWFVVGAFLYGIPAVGWYFLMKSHSLAMIGVMYSASTLILLTMLGFFVFKESLGWREMLGVSLAIAAVFVMSQSES